MKIIIIVLTVVSVIVLLGVALEVWSKKRHRRWRKWFDSLSYSEQRKKQEEMYKRQQMR